MKVKGFIEWINESQALDLKNTILNLAPSILSDILNDMMESIFFSISAYVENNKLIITTDHNLGEQYELKYDLTQTMEFKCTPILIDLPESEYRAILLGAKSSPEIILDAIQGVIVELKVSLDSDDIYQLEYLDQSKFELEFSDEIDTPDEKVNDLLSQIEDVVTEEYIREDQIKEIISNYYNEDEEE